MGDLQPKGAGWLLGAILQTAFGALVTIRGCAAMASPPPSSDSYAVGSMVGLLFGALVLFLGLRALRIYRRSRRPPVTPRS